MTRWPPASYIFIASTCFIPLSSFPDTWVQVHGFHLLPKANRFWGANCFDTRFHRWLELVVFSWLERLRRPRRNVKTSSRRPGAYWMMCSLPSLGMIQRCRFDFFSPLKKTKKLFKTHEYIWKIQVLEKKKEEEISRHKGSKMPEVMLGWPYPVVQRNDSAKQGSYWQFF